MGRLLAVIWLSCSPVFAQGKVTELNPDFAVVPAYFYKITLDEAGTTGTVELVRYPATLTYRLVNGDWVNSDSFLSYLKKTNGTIAEQIPYTCWQQYRDGQNRILEQQSLTDTPGSRDLAIQQACDKIKVALETRVSHFFREMRTVTAADRRETALRNQVTEQIAEFPKLLRQELNTKFDSTLNADIDQKLNVEVSRQLQELKTKIAALELAVSGKKSK